MGACFTCEYACLRAYRGGSRTHGPRGGFGLWRGRCGNFTSGRIQRRLSRRSARAHSASRSRQLAPHLSKAGKLRRDAHRMFLRDLNEAGTRSPNSFSDLLFQGAGSKQKRLLNAGQSQSPPQLRLLRRAAFRHQTNAQAISAPVFGCEFAGRCPQRRPGRVCRVAFEEFLQAGTEIHVMSPLPIESRLRKHDGDLRRKFIRRAGGHGGRQIRFRG